MIENYIFSSDTDAKIHFWEITRPFEQYFENIMLIAKLVDG